MPDNWPVLPADLCFLSDGSLWCWPAEGGEPETLTGVSSEEEQVLEYRMTPDGHYLAYLTAAGELRFLDHSSGADVLLPTWGEFNLEFHSLWFRYRNALDQFAITPDGHYLVYLAWGVEPGTYEPTGITSATLLAMDLPDPNQQFELGPCLSSGGDFESPALCLGFALAPDGRQVVFFEAQGLWTAQVPGGNPHLLVERTRNIMPHRCDLNYPRSLSWSPDQAWLLARTGCYEGDYWTVVDIQGGRLHHFPEDTWCYVGCQASGAVWGPAGVWVNDVEVFPPYSHMLYLSPVLDQETLPMTRLITETAAGPLRPIAVYPLPDGRVGFAHQGCSAMPGPDPALFFLEPDDSLTAVAPLPLIFCDPEDYGYESLLWGLFGQSTVVWSPEGQGFLYLDHERRPALLGLTDGSALWDVRELLAGAEQFRWAEP